ncbi:ATP synthase F1 subcomplex delta subunit [Chitinophaga jiangningensis]|uniref:ATP synthase subunit delta n=1 Tax=Chitinophaga jiangningensis TaxID=1419482 RepID=A0A1M7H7C0_9BACT|nr:ATP synthase F1 subunit delta [Chitinophaga jiangningensis]SHM24256.1 ATP synthase F1 subcomplex delta subunit [Chitinophaga jiangningensis]
MQNPRLASRYAKSLIDLVLEKNQLEEVHNDMLSLQQVMKTNRDLVLLLRSPIIKADAKQKILDAVLNGRVSQTTQLFIKLLVNKGRESNLPEIAAEFGQQYNVIKNIATVKITTAVPMEQATLDLIKQRVADGTQQVQLEAKVKPELIGGFVLEAGDQLYDASIQNELNGLRQQFTKNMYVSEIR